MNISGIKSRIPHICINSGDTKGSSFIFLFTFPLEATTYIPLEAASFWPLFLSNISPTLIILLLL
jgi:hypothetical protein